MKQEKDYLKVCEHCLQGISSHNGHQPIYKVVTDLDIEEDEQLICEWCECETEKLYFI